MGKLKWINADDELPPLDQKVWFTYSCCKGRFTKPVVTTRRKTDRRHEMTWYNWSDLHDKWIFCCRYDVILWVKYTEHPPLPDSWLDVASTSNLKEDRE